VMARASSGSDSLLDMQPIVPESVVDGLNSNG
jgi:hypothetical protein